MKAMHHQLGYKLFPGKIMLYYCGLIARNNYNYPYTDTIISPF